MQHFRLSVPATSANIGPGFDVMGIAFDLHNRFTFRELPQPGLQITGCPAAFQTEDNLVYRTLRDQLMASGHPVPGLAIHFESDIPLCSGLGSSSTCIVAGLMAADVLGNLHLGVDEILRRAALLEGHPDNIAPAILGGLIFATIQDDEVFWYRHPVSDKLSFIALMPEWQVPTHEARAILPPSYTSADCVFNMSHIPLLLQGLEMGDKRLVRIGCQDRIHQDYRAKLIPDFPAIKAWAATQPDLCSLYISGAGPTLVAIIEHDDGSFAHNWREHGPSLTIKWSLRKMAPCPDGAKVRML